MQQATDPEDGWSFLVPQIQNLADTLGASRLTTNAANAPTPVRNAIRQLADELTWWGLPGEGHAVGEPSSRTFHGVSGETLIVGHDEDGVMIRAPFRGNKLSASGARELARHLIACADLADDWMASAADPGPGPIPLSDTPEPCPDRCEHPLTVHSADLGCWLCDCTHGRAASGQETTSEYRYHEPEPWQ